VCEAADAELRAACQLLGPVGNRAVFTLLVQDKDPPLADWIASGCFDIVLLPARRRPRRRTKHPAADQVRRSTRAEVRVVEAGSNFEGPGVETPRAVGDKLGAPIDGVHSTRRRAEDTLPAKASEAVSAGAGPVHGRGATSGASGDGRAVRATGLAALGA
jgi:hypothetical protein